MRRTCSGALVPEAGKGSVNLGCPFTRCGRGKKSIRDKLPPHGLGPDLSRHSHTPTPLHCGISRADGDERRSGVDVATRERAFRFRPLNLNQLHPRWKSRMRKSPVRKVFFWLTDSRSILQGGYQHPLSRSWQQNKTLTKSMLMYPIFITDDPEASVVIKSLPGQRRWGVSRLEGFIGPLVEKGLKSVILFGVPLNCVKVRLDLHFLSNLALTLPSLPKGSSRNARGRPTRSRNPRHKKAEAVIPVALHRL